MPGVEPKHEYRCSSCGYGAVARAEPARCPMCQTELWEHAPWRPFSRGLNRSAVLAELQPRRAAAVRVPV
jgi:hypothetical protein